MPEPLHPRTKIGHVHLQAADMAKSIEFYRQVLGCELVDDFGDAAFLSAGGYHHHIGLNTWENWPLKADGKPRMYSKPLDMEDLLAQAHRRPKIA